MKTAQILIIGDEILSGRTADTNSHYLAKALAVRGVRVARIDILPDNLILISQWIRDRHGISDYVFVCGGIGGTPDDVTREAVARGLNLKLARNPVAEKLLMDFYTERKLDANPDRMSMADLPEGCELIENSVTKAPGIKIKNIYVFAGIPKVLYAMFEGIQDEFLGRPLFEQEINIKVGEGEVAKFMRQLNKEFPLLELGSYPTLDPGKGYKTQLVFKAAEKEIVTGAVSRFKELCNSSFIS